MTQHASDRISEIGNRRRSLVFLIALLSVLFVFEKDSVSASDNETYFSITGPCGLEFPRDHGPHHGYRTEWWYYTGNLRAKTGERFGFQLTFFRSQMSPSGQEKTWPKPASAWRSQQIIIGHAALSDIDGKRFLHTEEIGREAVGIAGARRESETATVFLKNWSVRLSPQAHQLKAVTDDFSFELTAIPLKEPVLHGDTGYSLKGSTPERSSCYYSFTRLETRGMLTTNGKTFSVEGSAWMDHEFSSAPLEPGLAGWDWFSLQLSDNTELMIYLLREKDGGYSPASGGTFVETSGKAIHLSSKELHVEISDYWKSPHTGTKYPCRWNIRVPSLKLNLSLVSNLADQEMQSPETTRVTYWEGSVSVKGNVGERSVTGAGYVELTGYEKAFDAPM